MNKRHAQLCSLVVLPLLSLSVISSARFKAVAQEIAQQVNVASAPLLKEIVNYRQWTRVNEKPQFVLDASAIGG